MTMAHPSASSAIAWDVYDGMSQHTGIAIHARELCKALKVQGINPVIFSQGQPARPMGRLGGKLFSPIVSFLKAKATFAGAERWVYHGLSNLNLPLIASVPDSCRLVLTVHDLIPLLEIGLVSRSLQLQFRMIFPRVLAKADAVIAVSEWTKDSILSYFPNVDAKKIIVIENGVDHLQRPYQIIQPKRPSLLFVSRYEPYKGFDSLLSIIKEKSGIWDFNIVTNDRGRMYLTRNSSEIQNKSNNVLIHVGISDDELRKLYEISSVIFHPSRYEGFGFPIYEALSYGKTVVCLKSPVWKNLGHCPLVFQSESEKQEAWLEKLETALRVKASPYDANENFVKKFSLPTWQDAAIKTKRLYNSI